MGLGRRGGGGGGGGGGGSGTFKQAQRKDPNVRISRLLLARSLGEVREEKREGGELVPGLGEREREGPARDYPVF